MTAAVDTEAVAEAAEEVVDLSAFTEAVEEVSVEEAGNPKNDNVKAVRQAYTDLSRKGKAAAKKWLADEGQKAVESDDFARAKLLGRLRDNGTKVIAASTGESTRKGDDEKLVEVIKGLAIGYGVATARAAAGVATDWQERSAVTDEDVAAASAYADWIAGGQEGTEPTATDDQKAGARVSLGRGPKGQGRKPGPAKADVAEGENTGA